MVTGIANPDGPLGRLRERFRQYGARLDGTEAVVVRDSFCRERFRQAASTGLLASCISRAYGGRGWALDRTIAAVEGFSLGCRDSGLVYGLGSQLFGVHVPLQIVASDELRMRYLPRLVKGELLAAHAVTEAEAGSDPSSIRTVARRTRGQYVLDGAKSFVTNAPDADIAIVFAKTDDSGPMALSAFLVETSWAGVWRGPAVTKLGLSSAAMGELHFDGVRVPATHLIGGEGSGSAILTETTSWERAFLLSTALGPMALSVDEAISHACSRRQFGRPIGSFQQVAEKIADMVVRLRVARLLIYDLARRVDPNRSIRPYLQDAAIAKLVISESSLQQHLDALQIFGVRGYLVPSPQEQRVRDSIGSTIYSGTSEIMRNLIARCAGLPSS